MSGREEDVRKTDKILTRVIELWPLWLTLAGGLVTAINFWNTVKDLAADQKNWKVTVEQRREKNKDDEGKRDDRITRLEKDVEWLKLLRGAK